MIGGIIGDYVGSTYEIFNTKKYNFNLSRIGSRYTDDTVLMMATIDCYLNNGDYAEYYRKYCLKYKFRGYGVRFVKWAYLKKEEPYYSMGNGSAVRAIPVGYIGKTLHEVMNLAEKTAIVTHNHPEGIIGAKVMAVSIFLLRKGCSKIELKEKLNELFDYDLSSNYEKLKDNYKGGGTCLDTVPQSISLFLDSTDFEDAIRKAVSIGGDSDTIACLVGSLAEIYYKEIDEKLKNKVLNKLPKEFKSLIKELNDLN